MIRGLVSLGSLLKEEIPVVAHPSPINSARPPRPPPRRYRYPAHRYAFNLSKIRVWGARALPLTSREPLPNSQGKRPAQSILRISYCQSIHPPPAYHPSQSPHTNHSGQYCQSTHQSRPSLPSRCRNNSRPTQRGRRTCALSSLPAKVILAALQVVVSRSTPPISLATQVNLSLGSLVPLAGGYSTNRIPDGRSTIRPCRTGYRGVPTWANSLVGTLRSLRRGRAWEGGDSSGAGRWFSGPQYSSLVGRRLGRISRIAIDSSLLERTSEGGT